MKYTLEYKDFLFELPTYNLDIASKLEKCDNTNSDHRVEFKTKVKQMYNFCCDILGKDEITNTIGDFKTCDPNEVNILYLEICNVYNSPLSSFNENSLEDIFNSDYMEKISELVKLAETAKAMNKK